jgi:hypothetical protein
MDAKTRQQLAVKRGVRLALLELMKQLLNVGDAASLEAGGLLALAAARLTRDQVDVAAEASGIVEHREARQRERVRR